MKFRSSRRALTFAIWLGCVSASFATAQIQTAGTVFVDLNAGDLKEGAPTTWTNHGTLGDFSLGGSATVETFDFARGLNFKSPGDGATCAKPEPEGLSGNGDWSVEVWVYNPSGRSEEGVVAWGDRPDRLVELSAGTSRSVVTWDASKGDLGWTDKRPTQGRWQYIAWTCTGGRNAITTQYLDGAKANEFTGGEYHTDPDGPVTVGGVKTANDTWATAGFTGVIGRVRIHDGVLTAAQIKSNFDAEKKDYRPKNAAKIDWQYPLSGKVVEFGDTSDANSPITKHIAFKNDGGVPIDIRGYEIGSGDAAAFSLRPAAPRTGSIAPGELVSFDIRFAPSGAAEANASLAIKTAQTSAPLTIQLRGNVARTFVSPLGSDDTGNGTKSAPLATLRKAIEVAKPGDVIEAAGGTYESFQLLNADRQVRLVSPGKDARIETYPTQIGTDEQSNFTIEWDGFTFDSTQQPFKPNAAHALGLLGPGTFDVTFKDCNMQSCWVNDLGSTSEAKIVRIHAENSTFYASNLPARIAGEPERRHFGIQINSELCDITAVDCDFRGSTAGIVVEPNRYASTASFTNCKFGKNDAARSWIGVIGSNAAAGTSITVTQCAFDGFTGAALSVDKANVSVFAKDSHFTDAQSAFIYIQTLPTVDFVPQIIIASCDFKNTRGSALLLSDGIAASLTDCSITGNRTTGILVRREEQTTKPMPYSLIASGCTIEGGTVQSTNTLLRDIFPAAVMVERPDGDLKFDQCNFFGATQQRVAPATRSNGLHLVAPKSLALTNSVIEGTNLAAQIAAYQGSTSVQSVRTIANCTLVATQDSSHTAAIINSDGNSLLDVKDCIILGYTQPSTGAVNAQNNFTTGDPQFTFPNPFVLPTKPGEADYRLKSGSPAIGKGATQKQAAESRNNVPIDKNESPIN